VAPRDMNRALDGQLDEPTQSRAQKPHGPGFRRQAELLSPGAWPVEGSQTQCGTSVNGAVLRTR